MITIIKSLLFDKELVAQIKKTNPGKDFLYTQLISGKITLQEYIAAC
jgi:hypothetical protein